MKNDITCIFLTPTPTHRADKHSKFQLGEVGHLRVDLKGQFLKHAILDRGQRDHRQPIRSQEVVGATGEKMLLHPESQPHGKSQTAF